MSVVKSSRNKNQLLLDGYRFRRANKSQVIWRCCKNDCAGRLHLDEIECVKVTDHVNTSNSEEIISGKFTPVINRDARTSHDPW